MEAYDRSSQDVCSELKTEPRSGLTSTHAEEILTQVGENRLKAKRKQTVVERFFSQFKDAMILILLAAAAISFYVALQGSDPTEFFEPALILLIVIYITATFIPLLSGFINLVFFRYSVEISCSIEWK